MNMGKRFLITLLSLFLLAGSAFAYDNPRWFTMPISVYIEKNNDTETVAKAFKAWQSSSGGALRFLYRSSKNFENISNITVTFVDMLPDGSLYKVTPIYSVVSRAHRNTGKGFFYKNQVVIARKTINGKALTSTQIYAIALRAAGEAVGVKPVDNSAAIMSNTSNGLGSRTVTKSDISALNKTYKK